MWKVFFRATPAYVLLVKKSTFHFLCPDSCYFAIPSENLWDTCGFVLKFGLHLTHYDDVVSSF